MLAPAVIHHIRRINTAMCKYYAHTHPCGHTKTVFAAFCPSAAMRQKQCARGDIWATVKLETNCAHCFAELDAMVLRSAKRSVGKKVARR